MSEHFKKFFQQQKETYLETAKKKFEESFNPLFTQLMQCAIKDDFDIRAPAIKALLKIVRRRYLELIDELQAAGREAEAIKDGEEWLRNLTADYYEKLIARYPGIEKGREK